MSSKERKSMIVDAVLSIADVDGPDRLSTIEIAKASGLTHAGIFRHFPTKKDIWIAVANEIAIRAKTHWQEPLLSNNAPREKVEILVGSHFEFLTETPAILTILFSYELQHANAQLREILTKLMLEFRKHLADEFTRAKYDKSEAMDLAFLIIALVQGLAMRWAVSQRKFNLEKEGKRLLKVQLDLISFSK
jgi:AcrR family transcriptional regulator